MNLTPLFAGQPLDKHLGVIDANLGTLGSSLYVNVEQWHFDWIALLDTAVKIKDENDRKAFAELIARWAVACNSRAEAHKAIDLVRTQVRSLVSHGGES